MSCLFISYHFRGLGFGLLLSHKYFEIIFENILKSLIFILIQKEHKFFSENADIFHKTVCMEFLSAWSLCAEKFCLPVLLGKKRRWLQVQDRIGCHSWRPGLSFILGNWAFSEEVFSSFHQNRSYYKDTQEKKMKRKEKKRQSVWVTAFCRTNHYKSSPSLYPGCIWIPATEPSAMPL